MSDGEQDKSPRHRRVTLDLPDPLDLDSVAQGEIAVIKAAATGQISSRVALDFTTMLDHRRRVLADRELEERMDAIEEANRRRSKRRSEP